MRQLTSSDEILILGCSNVMDIGDNETKAKTTKHLFVNSFVCGATQLPSYPKSANAPKSSDTLISLSLFVYQGNKMTMTCRA